MQPGGLLLNGPPAAPRFKIKEKENTQQKKKPKQLQVDFWWVVTTSCPKQAT